MTRKREVVEHEITKNGHHRVHFNLSDVQKLYLKSKAAELLESPLEEVSLTYREILGEEPTNISLRAFYALLRSLQNERIVNLKVIEGGKGRKK